MAASLPEGRRGRLLALGVTAVLLALVWAGAIDPLLRWQDDLANRATIRQALAQRMEALADTAPLLRRQAAAVAPPADAPAGLLDGATDAVAAAQLQGRLQQLTAGAGATLASVETLPAEAAGTFRRIGLRLTVSGPWPVLVRLLEAIDRSIPRLLVDDLSLQAVQAVVGSDARPVNATLSVIAFRAATP